MIHTNPSQHTHITTHDFSQFGEQPKLLEMIRTTDNPCFIDIGANEGMSCSNTFELHQKGWFGVYIEPAPDSFRKLLTNVTSRALFMNCAVSPKNGLEPFYKHISGLGPCSGNSSSVLSFIKMLSNPQYEELIVAGLTLNSILSMVAPFSPTVLSLDVDARNYDVMLACDFPYKPRIFIFEKDFPDENRVTWNIVMNRLHSFGYTLAWENTVNTCVVCQ